MLFSYNIDTYVHVCTVFMTVSILKEVPYLILELNILVAIWIECVWNFQQKKIK